MEKLLSIFLFFTHYKKKPICLERAGTLISKKIFSQTDKKFRLPGPGWDTSLKKKITTITKNYNYKKSFLATIKKIFLATIKEVFWQL